MIEEEKSINLRFDNYKQRGLYLILKDLTRLELTRENLKKVTLEFWESPDKIPPHVKKAVVFRRCPLCPLREKGIFCDALQPILPFLDVVDKYSSFDEVTAIYKETEKGLYHISNTTMQEALKYVSILSLMQYCQVGRKYWKYYYGIIPLMEAKEMASRLYLNIYWLHRGDKDSIKNIVSKLMKEITITSQNQVKRLNLICKNDAFINAFVSMHIATVILSMDIEKILKESFENF